jgi:hypothetical protein
VAIGPDCRTVGVVGAPAGEPGEERCDRTVRRDLEDAAAFNVAALGDIEGAFGEHGARGPPQRALLRQSAARMAGRSGLPGGIGRLAHFGLPTNW